MDINLKDKKHISGDMNLSFDVAVSAINTAIKKAKHDKNMAIIGDFLNEHHGSEIQKVLMHVDGEIESIDDVDDNAWRVIRNTENGRKLHNRIFIWYMEGEQDPEILMQRYNEYRNDYPAFRTMYIAKGVSRPLKIVLKSEDTVFPITSLIGLSSEKQNFIIKNVLAAEIRHVYDVERDSILKLQVYEIGHDKIIVILSMYAFPGVEFGGVRNFLFKVFDGYKVKEGNIPHVNDPAIERMNKTIKKKALAYWEGIRDSMPKAAKYPGMNLDNLGVETESIYFSLGEKITQNLSECAEKMDVDPSAIIMKAWGKFLAQQNNVEKVALGMVCKGESLNVIPVIYDDGEAVESLWKHISESIANTVVSLEEIDEYLEEVVERHFKCVHNFFDYTVINDTMSLKKNGEISINSYRDLEKVNPPLTINYYFFDDKLSINYVYKQNLYIDDDINKLHDMFVKVLEDVIEGLKTGKKGKKPKKSQAFNSEASPSEQKLLEEKRVQQKAQALQDSGIFVGIPFGSILELARRSQIVTFSHGDAIIAEGMPTHSVYVIMDGQVAQSKSGNFGRTITGAFVEHGGVMGLESILIDTKSLTRLEVASDYVTCLEISNDTFLDFANLYTSVYRAVTQKILTYTQGLFNVISEIKGKAEARERILLKRRELEKKQISEGQSDK
ncbi:MAG: cyclic nucleotide-binding domain-containing protein [Lachnospiraceae bacterium]|nr:cyclic nucleotide-binding domain-containing protein [Lachnospiraceae bacterium]